MKLQPNILKPGDVVRASISIDDLPSHVRSCRSTDHSWRWAKKWWVENRKSCFVWKVRFCNEYGRHVNVTCKGCSFVMREHELEKVEVEDEA